MGDVKVYKEKYINRWIAWENFIMLDEMTSKTVNNVKEGDHYKK